MNLRGVSSIPERYGFWLWDYPWVGLTQVWLAGQVPKR